MQKNNPKKKVVSGQTQPRPGLESEMSPPPVFLYDLYRDRASRLKLHQPICFWQAMMQAISRDSSSMSMVVR